MSEQILNQGSMYESIQGIQELNQVEGFDPRKYMRQLAGDGQGVKYYLDVVYRKLWFRLKYPNGKIVKKLIKLTDQVAIVEAKVYLDRNDPEESFIANALAQKYLTGDDQFGNKYVELAETAAVGRALADAGFGLQFADLEGETDPAIVDAGIEHFADAGTENVQDAGTFQEMKTGAVPDEEVQLPGQYDIRDYMDQNENQQYADTTAVNTAGSIPPAMQMAGGGSAGSVQKPVQSQTQNRPQNPLQSSQNPVRDRQAMVQGALSHIQREQPVEQIYKMLFQEMAVAVVISAGFFHG